MKFNQEPSRLTIVTGATGVRKLHIPNAIARKQAEQSRKRVGAEVVAGIGAESIRFYQGIYNCDLYGNCSNYVSSTHFLGDLGGGLRIYAYRNFFIRPEMRLYFIHNNMEFNSNLAVRYGASIGYTFGGTK